MRLSQQMPRPRRFRTPRAPSCASWLQDSGTSDLAFTPFLPLIYVQDLDPYTSAPQLTTKVVSDLADRV